MKRHRESIEIIYDVLDIAAEPVIVSTIARRGNVSHSFANRILQKLSDLKYVTIRDKTNEWIRTHEGWKFMKEIEKYVKYGPY